MADSFLDRRLAELDAGEQAVPLEYDALRAAAREQLDADAFAFAATGAGTEDTLSENRAAFGRHRIVNRVLRDVSERNLGTELFDRSVAAPLAIAPVGGLTRFDEAGDLAVARAARELGVPQTVSTAGSHDLEAIAEANGEGPRFFQLYWPRAAGVAESLVTRAAAAGYDAVVLTVDFQGTAWRPCRLEHGSDGRRSTRMGILESDPAVQELAQEAGMPVGEFVRESAAMETDPSLTWDDLDQLRSWTDLPIVLKGLLSPADARRAADWGAEGIVVSNHGGRQIDGEVAPLDQLPAIVEAVGDDLTVLLDSGIRGGADVFKALGLGADAVLFGRPFVYGLTLAGQRGVYETVLNCLAELESVMALSGRPSIDEIGPNALTRPDTGSRRFSGG